MRGRSLVSFLMVLSGCNDGPSGDGSSASDTDAITTSTSSTASGTQSGGSGSESEGSESSGDPSGACERPIDWTPGETVGVPGGIRGDRTKCETAACQAVENAEAGYRDGTLDATGLIQAAIESAEPETYVSIPAGTWQLSGGLGLGHERDAITVRGAGMDETILDCRGQSCFGVGSGSDYLWSWPETGNEITAGLARGSSEITIADTSAFNVGQLVQIKIANDPALPVVSVAGFGELRKQMAIVTGKTDSTLTIDPPIFGDFDGMSARVNAASQQTDFAGIEDLTMDCSAGTSMYGATFGQAYGCWLKGVKIRRVLNYSVSMGDSVQCEMRASYLDELNHGEVPNGAGLLLGSVTASLFEDNIIVQSFPDIEVNHGSTGNVFGYNFINNVSGVIGIDTNHGPHNAFNLYEGNVAHNLMSDGYFGSVSDDYVFRNWLHGGGGVPGNAPTYCLSLKRFTRNYTVVGNIIGSPGQTQPCVGYGEPNIGNNAWAGEAQPSSGDSWADWTPEMGTTIHGTLTERTDDMHGTVELDSGSLVVGQSPFLVPGGWVIVTSVAGNTVGIDSSAWATVLPPLDADLVIWGGAGGFQELDLDVEATTTKHSNYYFAGASIPAEEASDEPLCDSLYHDAKPEWFGDSPWPPFDPTDPTTVDNEIPARARFGS
jgi:hypothetical protein